MDPTVFKLAELFAFFGIGLAWIGWQIWEVRRPEKPKKTAGER